MHAPAGRNWSSADDYRLASFVVILIGLGVFGWLAWTRFHAEISAGFIRAAHWHVLALQRYTDAFDALDQRMLAADPARVTPGKLWQVAGVIGVPLRLPVALLLCGLAVPCFFRAASARFTRKLDLDGLLREQARTFRSTAAFAERKLGVVAPREGEPRPADPALHPGEWLRRYAAAEDGGFDAAAASAELARQLGPVWQGVRDAAPHVRVLYAAFALHLAQRRAESLSLLGEMAEALAKPAPDEGPGGPEQPLAVPAAVAAVAARILRDPAVAGPAAAITARHAYAAPALMGLLTEARRQSGGLAPAQFNSLRLVDRRLWYALHSLGFPTDSLGQYPHPNPLIEAIGARDHWAVECLLGMPLHVPATQRAAAAVCAAAADTARLNQAQERQ